jgi:heptaprenyl diphosphate synthase
MVSNPNASLIGRLRWLASDTLGIVRGALPAALAIGRGDPRVGPAQLDAIQQCTAWLNDYIGKPHPELGRNGDICPFVRTALRKQRMTFVVLDQFTTPDVDKIRARVMYEAWRLARHLDESDRFAELTTTNLLFPGLKDSAAAVVHTVHQVCKTNLMRKGIMVAAFYPGYDKPAIYNDRFQLYQSPFPVVVVRPMALHDILFLDRNREAFIEYHRRFAQRYHAGLVSSEFGYPERFRDAEQRFGLN